MKRIRKTTPAKTFEADASGSTRDLRRAELETVTGGKVRPQTLPPP